MQRSIWSQFSDDPCADPVTTESNTKVHKHIGVWWKESKDFHFTREVFNEVSSAYLHSNSFVLPPSFKHSSKPTVDYLLTHLHIFNVNDKTTFCSCSMLQGRIQNVLHSLAECMQQNTHSLLCMCIINLLVHCSRASGMHK